MELLCYFVLFDLQHSSVTVFKDEHDNPTLTDNWDDAEGYYSESASLWGDQIVHVEWLYVHVYIQTYM